MSCNNAISDFDLDQRPDNPHETLSVQNYYYAGFAAGEMTCSIIRATNYNPKGHYYYAVDFTVSNADKNLLEQVNTVMMQGRGVISPIKGGYNCKSRGKNNVRIVLDFLRNYPILAGDLAKNRVVLLEQALEYLTQHRGRYARESKTKEMERIRKALRDVKTKGIVEQTFPIESNNHEAVGYFLSGVLDGEGSFGFKRCNDQHEPFIAMAMKDRKVVELLRNFVQHGNVRLRKDGASHLEINQKAAVTRICDLFLYTYPLKHTRQRQRLMEVQRILNDHTLRLAS